MSTLTLTFAAERAKYGRRAAAVPSRFLFEARGEALPEGWVGVEADADDGDGESELPAAKKRGTKKAGAGRRAAKAARPRPRSR